jgi:hypothetical protein
VLYVNTPGNQVLEIECTQAFVSYSILIAFFVLPLGLIFGLRGHLLEMGNGPSDLSRANNCFGPEPAKAAEHHRRPAESS